jgi:hypothetical protein
MFSIHRKIFAGIGLDLLAAAALTGIGFVFHAIVNQGSTLALFDVLLLGIAVVAILTAYNWFFNEASGKSEFERSRSQISMRRKNIADDSIGRNLPPSTRNDNAGVSRFPGRESVA